MKLMKRIKDILFDEEEVEIPVIEKEVKRKEIIEDDRIEKKDSITEIKIPEDDFSDKESLKSELTFPFPIEFDEDELAKTKPIETVNRKENVSMPVRESSYSRRYEVKKEQPKREVKDYSTYLKTKEEKKQFKPTPIISPVYGVLDQNYKKEDLVVRGEPVKRSSLDPKPELDDILKKAYGETVEIEDTKELQVIEDDIVIDPNKTIGELIEEESIETPILDNNISEDVPSVELNTLIEEKDEIEKKLQTAEDLEDDDTDLFSLIDSMYEENNKE